MKKFLFSLLFLVTAVPAIGCTLCNKPVREKIYDSMFFPNLLTMLSAFIVLGLLTAFLAFLSARRYKKWPPDAEGNLLPNPVPLTTASIVLGIGIGGFIDGIALHQILQWHEMLSAKMPPVTLELKTVNMFWDGIFHGFTLIVVFIGVVLLWKLLHRTNLNRSGKLFSGGLLTGWGMFNIIEGIIDHHLLHLHNVREITGQPGLWNYGFLAVSVLMLLIGFLLIRKAQHRQIWKERPVHKLPGTESIE